MYKKAYMIRTGSHLGDSGVMPGAMGEDALGELLRRVGPSRHLHFTLSLPQSIPCRERGQNRAPPKIEWSLYSVKKCLIDAM